MSLREEIKVLSGNRRRYLLLRISDLDPQTSFKLVGVTRGTYNSWLQNGEFVALHRRIPEFSREHKQEAIQLLRRDNQLEAVLLEAKIIKKMKDEIEAGEYNLVKSNLAREVYSKLISELDVVPQTQVLSWEQRLAGIFVQSPREIGSGELVTEGEFIAIPETDPITENQPSESELVPKGEQASHPTEEETQG